LISGTSEVIDNAPVELLPENINPNSIRHVVQRGENLAAIGQRYGVSWLAIAQANDIFDADRIVAGQELLIPNILSGSDAILEVPAAPAPVHGIGREIIVDLSEQRTYAYENGVLVRNVVVSTGLPGTPTVRGDFTVQRKYVAQTMTGPGYYRPDVPYILYFYAGYALHGTYWHSNFGQPMSHGCVNLPTPEAEWFYSFADVGTPVHVQA
jgi:LysM repeat protein